MEYTPTEAINIIYNKLSEICDAINAQESHLKNIDATLEALINKMSNNK